MARRKNRQGLESRELTIANLTNYLPAPRSPHSMKTSFLPALFVVMKNRLAMHSVVVEDYPSLGVNNIGLYGISELVALVILEIPPRLFLLLCWYGGEGFSRLPCRIIGPHRTKTYVSCPLHTDKLMWFEAYKRLRVEVLIDLLVRELQSAYEGRFYSVMNLNKEMMKEWVLDPSPVVKKIRRKKQNGSANRDNSTSGEGEVTKGEKAHSEQVVPPSV